MTPIRCSVLVALFVLFALPATAFADGPELSGTYHYDEARSDSMVDAFEPAIDEMNRIARGVARRRVRNQPPAPATVRIEQTASQIVVDFQGTPAIRAPLDGSTVDYVNADGETEKVTARVDGPAILIHRDFDDGEYHTRYFIDSNGRLHIASRINMDSLPKVVNYTRIYTSR